MDRTFQYFITLTGNKVNVECTSMKYERLYSYLDVEGNYTVAQLHTVAIRACCNKHVLISSNSRTQAKGIK